MASARYRLPRPPLDVWTIREKLALACCVLQSGDQNWVSVSRQIRQLAEEERPEQYFSQKNCAQQYTELLETVETPKRKRGEREATETPQLLIARKLTLERIEELRNIMKQEQLEYQELRDSIEEINAGVYDDHLADLVKGIKKEDKDDVKAATGSLKQERGDGDAVTLTSTATADLMMTPAESSSSMDFTPSAEVKVKLEEDVKEEEISIIEENPDTDQASTVIYTPQDASATPTPASTPVPPAIEEDTKHETPMSNAPSESSEEHHIALIKEELSEDVDVDVVTEIADESEQLEAITTQPENEIKIEDDEPNIDENASTQATVNLPASSSDDIVTVSSSDAVVIVPDHKPASPTAAAASVSSDVKPDVTPNVKPDVKPDIKPEPLLLPPPPSDVATGTAAVNLPATPTVVGTPTTATPTSASTSTDVTSSIFVSTQQWATPGSGREMDDSSALSPTSSISSHDHHDLSIVISSGGRGQFSSRRGRVGRKRKYGRGRKQMQALERPLVSEFDTSDDDDAHSVASKHESLDLTPNSPAVGMLHSEGDMDERQYKMWKKSIVLVWRAIANHKNAHIFMHPVREDIAPGYSKLILRPMDLTTIKRRLESGEIRTTLEFQRDMQLMFINAMMYNDRQHAVYKIAMDMYDDVMKAIEEFASTQLLQHYSTALTSEGAATPTGKMLRQSRRSETQTFSGSEKEEDTKKRRPSTEQDFKKRKH